MTREEHCCDRRVRQSPRSQAPPDLRPKIVVYLSWYKQRKTVLFFLKQVYRFATGCEIVTRNKMDDLAKQVKSTNFHATHNNINLMFRISHQQADHNSHFDSGTAVTVFLPPNEADFQLPETDEEFLRQAAKGTQTPIT